MKFKWLMSLIWTLFSIVILLISTLFPHSARLQYWLSMLAPAGFLLICIIGYQLIAAHDDEPI